MSNKSKPKFSFLTIVFNGDDFIYQSLMSVYEFAHEIFVVEGAEMDAWCIANADGSSTDKTNEILKNFPDPENKIKFFHGKWKSKEEMTNAPLKYVTGDYIWRLDSDEVYKKKDLYEFSKIISERPEITHVTFLQQEFFKGFERIMVPKNGLKKYLYDKIWKFENGSYFIGHRPPDLYSPSSNKFMGKGVTLSGVELEEKYNINIYHYSMVTDKQAIDKMIYFSNVYLRRFAVGIPFWSIVGKIPVIRDFYRFFFSMPIFDKFRKQRSFPEMNFDYYNTVWEKWEGDQDTIEEKYGVTFNSKKPYITIPFLGTHPETIQEMISSND